MSEELKNQMNEIDQVEVEAITDGELEDVAGGAAVSCSNVACSHLAE